MAMNQANMTDLAMKLRDAIEQHERRIELVGPAEKICIRRIPRSSESSQNEEELLIPEYTFAVMRRNMLLPTVPIVESCDTGAATHVPHAYIAEESEAAIDAHLAAEPFGGQPFSPTNADHTRWLAELARMLLESTRLCGGVSPFVLVDYDDPNATPPTVRLAGSPYRSQVPDSADSLAMERALAVDGSLGLFSFTTDAGDTLAGESRPTASALTRAIAYAKRAANGSRFAELIRIISSAADSSMIRSVSVRWVDIYPRAATLTGVRLLGNLCEDYEEMASDARAVTEALGRAGEVL